MKRACEVEARRAAGDVDLEHQTPRTIRATGLASSSDAISAAKARAIETSVSRRAPGLAAGDLGEGVDRRGQGLGLARDVGDEGDRGAELAQAPWRRPAPCRRGRRAGPGAASPSRTPRGARRPSVAGRLLQPAVDRLERQPHGADQQRERHHPAGERRPGPAEREHDARNARPAAPRSARAGRRSAGADSR